jgi:N-[(2S)-2-amino-2-carboxyethyl]-L-glutamate dehydrogenase
VWPAAVDLGYDKKDRLIPSLPFESSNYSENLTTLGDYVSRFERGSDMNEGDLLILKGQEVRSLLAGREMEIIDAVKASYEAHAAGSASLPQSTFLRFPNDPRNRIIALPAYLGGEYDVAGIKWISSFPENINKGFERASAVVILNSAATGRPKAILEGAAISAKRTAASAVLAARHLHKKEPVLPVALVGCGVINFEITRSLLAVWPEARSLVVFETDMNRARQFRDKCKEEFGEIEVDIVPEIREALSNSSLISFATTAPEPHVFDLSLFAPGSVILHISLRDIAPGVILSCDNIVDDADHVCRAQTSVHLAEQQAGNRDFIRCTLADILMNKSPARIDESAVAIFSPFGLGILDLAVSKLAFDLALAEGCGMVAPSFCPT